jgi:hypothetical protein
LRRTCEPGSSHPPLFYQKPRAVHKTTDAFADLTAGRKHIGLEMGVRPNLFDWA